MRAIVLSSGGSKGFYHLGVLQYLYTKLKIKHEIICGTSIGALIGTYLAQYPYGQEEAAIHRLTDLFLSLDNNSVYKRWNPLGVVHAFLNKRSLYNSKPLHRLIDTHIDPLKVQETGKKLRIGVTLFNPQYISSKGYSNYSVHTEQDPELCNVVKASAAYAPFLEPVTLRKGVAVDGGIQTVTPIKMAIDAGATEIDVVICYPKYLTYPKPEGDVITDAAYIIDLMVNRLTWLDVERTEQTSALVRAKTLAGKRAITLNVIHPAAELRVNSLEFNSHAGQRLITQGLEDAKLVLK